MFRILLDCYQKYIFRYRFFKYILKDACPNLSGDCIDRAHRIGRDYKCHKTNKTCRSVIVRFTSFKHRTSIYRNRNILKDVRVKLDLTKKRYNILKSARSIADEKQDVNYVFADINCRKSFSRTELLNFLKMFQS